MNQCTICGEPIYWMSANPPTVHPQCFDVRERIEAETVAAIVAWARLNWRAYDATSKMLDAIERGEWHKERS